MEIEFSPEEADLWFLFLVKERLAISYRDLLCITGSFYSARASQKGLEGQT